MTNSTSLLNPASIKFNNPKRRFVFIDNIVQGMGNQHINTLFPWLFHFTCWIVLIPSLVCPRFWWLGQGSCHALAYYQSGSYGLRSMNKLHTNHPPDNPKRSGLAPAWTPNRLISANARVKIMALVFSRCHRQPPCPWRWHKYFERTAELHAN